jgi:predicted methyltransferase
MRLKGLVFAASLVALLSGGAHAGDSMEGAGAAHAAVSRPAAEQALDAGRKPTEVLALLQLAPGQRVLDVVAGGGYYTWLMAPMVAPGAVYAHTTAGLMDQEGMGARWSTLKAANPNVRLILGVPGQFPLPDRLDRVLFHLTFHDLWWESAEFRIPRMDPDLFLKQLHAGVVPGGLVLIVDHRAKAGAEPRAEAAARHRIDPAVAKAAMERAGFVLVDESGLLRLPADDLTKMVYDPAIRGKTDRFVMLWRRP